MGYVYIIRNKINNRVYVGSTTKSIEERFNRHMGRTGGAVGDFYSDVEKYGSSKFNVAELEYVEDEQELRRREYEWMQDLAEELGREFIYNTKLTAHESIVESARSPEARKKMIATQVKKYGSLAFHTPEARQKCNELSQTPEAKKKRVATQIEKYGSLAFHTPEARAKSIERANSPEVRAKRNATDRKNNGGVMGMNTRETIEKTRRLRANIIRYKGTEYAGLSLLRKALKKDGIDVPATTLNRIVQSGRYPKKWSHLEGSFELVRIGSRTRLSKGK